MASLSTIRDGLKTRLATIAGLEVYDVVPDQANVPCAMVGPPERITFDSVMQRGADEYLIPIRILVNRSDLGSAQDALDGYLAGAGATSVKAAIEGDVTLGGAVDTTRVKEARNYGAFEVGEITYLGVEFLTEVIG